MIHYLFASIAGMLGLTLRSAEGASRTMGHDSEQPPRDEGGVSELA
jgi:hypothetical protein